MRSASLFVLALALLAGEAGCTSDRLYVIRRSVWHSALALPQTSLAGVPVGCVADEVTDKEKVTRLVPAARLRPAQRLQVDEGWLVAGVSESGRGRSFLVSEALLERLQEGKLTQVPAVEVEGLAQERDVVPRSDLRGGPALPYDDEHDIVASRRRRAVRGVSVGGVMLMAVGTAMLGGAFYLFSRIGPAHDAEQARIDADTRQCLLMRGFFCGLGLNLGGVGEGIGGGLLALFGGPALAGGIALTVFGVTSNRPTPTVPVDPVLLNLDQQPAQPPITTPALSMRF